MVQGHELKLRYLLLVDFGVPGSQPEPTPFSVQSGIHVTVIADVVGANADLSSLMGGSTPSLYILAPKTTVRRISLLTVGSNESAYMGTRFNESQRADSCRSTAG